MKYELGFGKQVVEVQIPEKNAQRELLPNPVPHGVGGMEEVRRALQEPIGAPLLKDTVKPGQKIVIVTSDITRPIPSYQVLPPVLDELAAAGIPDSDITIVLALGSHRAHTEEEKRRLVGDAVYDRITCIDSDMDKCVQVGTTPDGTPVDMFEPVVNADVRILLGNIEFHWFVGYSGGAKALMPGVSSKRAIQYNHRRMVLPESCAGALETNPVRMDIEAILPFIKADYIVNVVLDEHKNIVHCVAGDVIEAHRVGCKLLDAMYAVKIDSLSDCVVVSQGGAPKDMNVYQAQKALDNARHAVRQGGTIVWVCSCAEGYGSASFERWLKTYGDPADCIKAIHENFELGGHKAAGIAITAQKARILFVNELDDTTTRTVYATPMASAQAAVDLVLSETPNASFLVMPYGGSTLPKLDME
ncbi:MAG: nickel-dependent lactate racemase [Clostridia bacterium]|nr:nickel-dependent lactate racemase [Clostridia bacterium]